MPIIIYKRGRTIYHGGYQLPKPVKNEVETIGQGIANMVLPSLFTFDKTKFDIPIKKAIKKKNIKIIL